MHKLRTFSARAALVAAVCLTAAADRAHATADRQTFFGFGLGVQMMSSGGSGSGLYVQGLGGYSFDSLFAIGLHAGYSNVGGLGVRVLDFGGFLQWTEADSGLYGKLYIDGVHASVDGGATRHGVVGSQTGFAPGLGVGMLLPPAGDFHMNPEVSYRFAILDSSVNLIQVAFNLVWDF